MWGWEKTSATSRTANISSPSNIELKTLANICSLHTQNKKKKTQNNLKAWDGGKPRDWLCLALNQCLSSQDLIVIPQQVAMEKSLIGSQTESTIGTKSNKAAIVLNIWLGHHYTLTASSPGIPHKSAQVKNLCLYTFTYHHHEMSPVLPPWCMRFFLSVWNYAATYWFQTWNTWWTFTCFVMLPELLYQHVQ